MAFFLLQFLFPGRNASNEKLRFDIGIALRVADTTDRHPESSSRLSARSAIHGSYECASGIAVCGRYRYHPLHYPDRQKQFCSTDRLRLGSQGQRQDEPTGWLRYLLRSADRFAAVPVWLGSSV